MVYIKHGSDEFDPYIQNNSLYKKILNYGFSFYALRFQFIDLSYTLNAVRSMLKNVTRYTLS